MSTRQKRLSFLLSVVFILSICGNLFGQAEFDYKQINLLRWMDPDRKPITYEEYLESRHFAKEFRTRCIYSSFKGMNPKGVTPLCIIVNNLLQPQIETAFLRFITDLEMEGYGINLYTATNNGDEEALKELLISEWNTRQIVGVILIGDLAVPWYEMTEPEDWGGNHVEFPIDLYYMDLDGLWMDADENGLYDGHLDGDGDMEADIWVGRLFPKNLTYYEAQEVAMMDNYLDKNHRYRTGELRLYDKALAYIDNDWCMYGWEDEVALAYPITDAVTDIYETNREDYMERIREFTDNRYENLLICSHSSPWAHYLYWGTGPWDYSLFHNYEIELIHVQVHFYNLFACSNCRFVENDDMGDWYLFQSTYGLLSVGSTKTGSMLCFYDYYAPLGEGKSFGDAFLDWCINNMETCAGSWSRPWFYGMTLLGDPTLKISRYMVNPTGDVNEDGNVDASDVIFLINYLFIGGPAPNPLALGDLSGDCL
ncbi:MAG: dockerin type I domain-containing protein, partial [Candidatus Zixiibacteriota bacterium]